MGRPKLTPEEKALAGLRHASIAHALAYEEAVAVSRRERRPKGMSPGASMEEWNKAEKRAVAAYWRAEGKLELAAAEYVGARLDAAGVLVSTLAVLKRKAEARHEYPTRKRKSAKNIVATPFTRSTEEN